MLVSFWIVSWMSMYNGECIYDTIYSQSPVAAVEGMAAPTRSFYKLLPESLGNVTGEPPEKITQVKDPAYILSCLGFAIPFFFFALFLACSVPCGFWFKCCFPCLTPRPGKPPVWLTLLHLFLGLVVLSGCFFMLVGAGNLTEVFTYYAWKTEDVPRYLTELSERIVGRINGATSFAIVPLWDLSGNLSVAAGGNEWKFLSALNAAPKAVDAMELYEEKVRSNCFTYLHWSTAYPLRENLEKRAREIRALANALDRNQDKIKDAGHKAWTVRRNQVTEMETAMDEIYETIWPAFSDIIVMNESFEEVIEPLYSISRASYVGPIFVCICSLNFLWLVFVCCCFCCNGKCSRCCMRCYPQFIGIAILAVLIAVPCSIGFMMADDICRRTRIEETIVKAKPDVFGGVSIEDQVNMIICEENKSLFEMGLRNIIDLDTHVIAPVMNIGKIIGNALDMSNFDVDELKDVGVGFNEEYFKPENIVGYGQVNFTEDDRKEMFLQCVGWQSKYLDNVEEYGLEIGHFGAYYYSAIANASADSQKLPELMETSIREALPSVFSSLTCEGHRCSYKPINDLVCVYWLDGCTWYILGTVIFLIGIIPFGYTTLFRHRQLCSIQVEAASSAPASSESSSSCSLSGSSSSESQEDPNMVKFEARPL